MKKIRKGSDTASLTKAIFRKTEQSPSEFSQTFQKVQMRTNTVQEESHNDPEDFQVKRLPDVKGFDKRRASAPDGVFNSMILDKPAKKTGALAH